MLWQPILQNAPHGCISKAGSPIYPSLRGLPRLLANPSKYDDRQVPCTTSINGLASRKA
jgi:hypothetical protein